jgi:hypothetical protein
MESDFFGLNLCFSSFFSSSDYGDGGVNAKLYIAPIPRTTTEENVSAYSISLQSPFVFGF